MDRINAVLASFGALFTLIGFGLSAMSQPSEAWERVRIPIWFLGTILALPYLLAWFKQNGFDDSTTFDWKSAIELIVAWIIVSAFLWSLVGSYVGHAVFFVLVGSLALKGRINNTFENLRPPEKWNQIDKVYVGNYRQYRKSEPWFQRRNYMLRRSGFKCQRCSGTKNLQIHHRTYKRLGRERPSDLVVLCRTCHRKEHRTHSGKR